MQDLRLSYSFAAASIEAIHKWYEMCLNLGAKR